MILEKGSLIDWFNNTYLCITHEVDFTLKNQVIV